MNLYRVVSDTVFLQLYRQVQEDGYSLCQSITDSGVCRGALVKRPLDTAGLRW